MKNIKRIMMFSLLLCLIVSFQAAESQEPKAGGTLRYAMLGTPPSLDQHVITSDLATMIAQHWSEGLYAFDASYAPVPMLAQNDEVKDGGKLVVIQLREGVPFHNGKEMTAEDVVASLQRWGEHGVRGPIVFQHVDKVEAVDTYTVNIYFKEPFAPWKNLFAFINGGPVIYPKEVVENAGAEPIPIEGYIGTGPYKFVEWNPGRYILLERFDDYAGRDEESNGYGGKRETYFEQLRFIPVEDVQTRVNGLRAGDYDYAQQIPGDLHEGFEGDPDIKIAVNEGALIGMWFFNSKGGIFQNNFALRRAVRTALEMEPALRAAAGPESLWKLNASIMPEGTSFYSEGGAEGYNVKDPEKAMQLAKEAGYNNEPIRIITTTTYDIIYHSAMVLAKQLKDAGFNIDLQIYDWATLVSIRIQPDKWDIFTTYHGFVPDPILYTVLSDNYPGWWTTEKKGKLTAEFSSTMDPVKRKEVWDQLQTLLYEEVPIVKTGDMFAYDIYSSKIEGIGKTSLIWPKFWGVWFQ